MADAGDHLEPGAGDSPRQQLAARARDHAVVIAGEHEGGRGDLAEARGGVVSVHGLESLFSEQRPRARQSAGSAPAATGSGIDSSRLERTPSLR